MQHTSFTSSDLYSFDASGTVRWKVTLRTAHEPALADDGSLYVASGHYEMPAASAVTALSQDGAILWTSAVVGFPQGPVTIATDGSLYLPVATSSSESFLYSIDPTTGATRWRSERLYISTASPVVEQGDHILLLDAVGVHSFRTSDGAATFVHDFASVLAPLPVTNGVNGSLVGTNDRLHFWAKAWSTTPKRGFDRGVIALSDTHGTEIWSAAPFIGAVIAVGDGVFYVAGRGSLEAYSVD